MNRVKMSSKVAMLIAMFAMALALTACAGAKRPQFAYAVYQNGKWVNVFYDTLAYEGKTYKTVKIGEKVWMAENLNHAVGNSKCNTDTLPEGRAKYVIGQGVKLLTFCEAHGSLYNWEDAMKACPAGWHLPTNAEWDELIAAAGGHEIAGKALKSQREKEWQRWKYGGILKEGKGDGKFSFNVDPAGFYIEEDGFLDFGINAFFWTSSESEYSAKSAQGYVFSNSEDKVAFALYRKQLFFNVRCIEGPASEAVAPAVVPHTEVKAEPAEPIEDARDNKTYKAVKIGEQTWMAENLNFEAKGSVCYDNKPENCEKYGRIYNWDAAIKACPAGWHLPTNAEWDALYRYADGSSGTESPYESKTAGDFLMATSGWKNNGNGEDIYGFAALPGGSGNSDGYFGYVGSGGSWWSSSEGSVSHAYIRYMGYDGESAYWNLNSKAYVYSVRCVKD